MNLKLGKNVLTFEYFTSEDSIEQKTVSIYLYESGTKFVVSDIDGTITKSDILGYVLPIFGFKWHFNELIRIYRQLNLKGYEFVFLTARSFREYNDTRKYLDELYSQKSQDSGNKSTTSQAGLEEESSTCFLPDGPLFMSPRGFIPSLNAELLHKSADIFKSRTLKEIKKTMTPSDEIDKIESCPDPFIAGFGNQPTDALAYKSASIPDDFNFVIKDNRIFMLSGKYKFSMEPFYKNLDKLFPTLSNSAQNQK